MDTTLTPTNTQKQATFKSPVMWGICIGGFLVVAAFWLATIPTIGTPLGLFGDLVVALVIVILEMALVAGIFSLFLRGLAYLFQRLGRRFAWATRISNFLTPGVHAPWILLWGLAGACLLLMVLPGNAALWLFPMLSATLCGGLIGFALNNRSWLRSAALGTAALIALASVYVFFFYGQDDYLAAESDAERSPASALQAANPGLSGDLPFRHLTYGSGTDLRRVEYNKDVSIQTQAVDASLLWQGYDGYFKTYYRQYWGFTPKELPLNARAWLPEGQGPFPLILFVHGNHNWNDFSDPGYAYLGEHLASRGYLVVSVDENFLNGFSFSDPGGVEIAARGWVILKHIELFQDWNNDPQSIFYKKVALNQIALVGHSNGGEAVAVAAYLNNLEQLPNNNMVEFDFHFPIKAVIQLAPSDGVYRPGGKPIQLENIDYLLLQGAHDSQVMSVSGLGQYHRTRFSSDSDNFKAAIYFYRGNHVLFNTAWDERDYAGINGYLLNQKPVMPPADQRQVAKSILTAFLEASLRDNAAYRAWFHDLRRGSQWLPDDIYINTYQDATFRVIRDYKTNSLAVPADCLDGMKCTELDVSLRFYNKPQDNRAVLLAWTDETAPSAAYALSIPTNIQYTDQDILTFSLAVLNESVNLQVELIDEHGQSARFKLEEIGPLHPALPTRLFRFPKLAKRLGYEEPQRSETMFQVYEIPLAKLQAFNPGFEPAHLTQIVFHADPGHAGQVWLDEIGFRAIR